MTHTKHTHSILGIDLGSRNVKICRINEDVITTKKTVESIDFYRRYGIRNGVEFSVDISELGISDVDRIIATGYGRMSVALTGAESISELRAHFLGARYQYDCDNFTLLDMGGQDYKVIRVRNGRMVEMATNDKCAASTGRYLENMARVLDITLEEIGRYSADPVELSSTCAIFGESELIGLIVKGEPVSRLAAGVNHAVVSRVLPLLLRMREDTIIMSGGVAFNPAIVKIVGEQTGCTVQVLPDPMHNGAIGCCVSGIEE